MTRSHFADALVYGYSRHGKWYRARCAYVLAVVSWASWYRGRPWDPPYVMHFAVK